MVDDPGEVNALQGPIAALNLGKTRADPLLSLKVEAPCGAALSACVAP